MTQPYHKRVSANDLRERIGTARSVANVRALHRQIRAEVDAELNETPTFEKVS